MKIIHYIITVTFFCCLLNASSTSAAEHKAAIASAHPLATLAGLDVLKRGGNAFDAAVAVSAALSVVEPSGSGLGGGGFWLLHRAIDGFETMVDGREKAPLAATKDMYLDQHGELVQGLSKNGPLAAAIPGMPAALAHLSERYGRLTLAQSLKPAIEFAEQGFEIGERHRRLLKFRLPILQKQPEAAKILLEHNQVPSAKAVLLQKDLAATLKSLAKYGRKGFYSGSVAKSLIKGVREAGGIWTLDDLDKYQVVERKPLKAEYQGVKITTAALPSSGGIVLIQALNILSGYDLHSLDKVTRKHVVTEAMRRAYHDRAFYLGDSDFIDVPEKRLINPDYAAGKRASIRLDKATPSEMLAGEVEAKPAGRNTTHFSIIDKEGNRVSATMSINYPFGSGLIPEGTGVILNDEMDDFVSKTGEMNGYGLVGGRANSIAPGKRMLSSMTPTFVETDNRLALLGTPGGSRIISMVLLAVLDFAEGKHADYWIRSPRYHHQYIPDAIQYEKGALTEEEVAELSELGHQLKPIVYRYGNMQAIELNKNTGDIFAVSDPRGEGVALVR